MAWGLRLVPRLSLIHIYIKQRTPFFYEVYAASVRQHLGFLNDAHVQIDGYPLRVIPSTLSLIHIYPIAKLAAKVAVGLTLDEIINPVTQTSYACVEPCIDYVVAKFPRFAFDKFPNGDRTLGTQMKATGEVMSIGRTFDEDVYKRQAQCRMQRLGSYNVL